jgi:uncharacterized membrane protein
MLNKKENINAKEWFLLIISLLIITDVSIILRLIILRETFSFLFFTIIPGMLIITIMRLDDLEFIKKALLWIGLSISLLMFGGLFLNSLYPYVSQPLSLPPILLTFNLIIISLALLSYTKNKENFNIGMIFNFQLDLKAKLVSPLLLPLIFPIMAILGTYLMNTTQNNIILLLMLFSIPLYIVVVVLLKEKVHKITYPISIWMIGLGLLLMHGLTSWHIVGRDVHFEYYVYNLALNGFHWSISEYQNPYNACLSITILPVIYSVLSNFNGEYIFKLFFALIGSVIPLVIYTKSKKYVGELGGFFASLLFVFQTYFIYILGIVRQEIAFLFFFLSILVLFESKIGNLSRKFLFIILICSVIVSHYATAYFAIALIFPILLLPFLKSLIYSIKYLRAGKNEKISFKNFDVIAIISAFLALWYLLFARVQAQAGNFVASSTIAATMGTSSAIAKSSSVLTIFGIGIKSVPNLIANTINDLILIIIAIGLFFLLKEYLQHKKQGSLKIEEGYVFGMIISVILLVSFVILPYISLAYGPQRLFLQVSIFLAPVFVIGAIYISKILKRPKIGTCILLILILSIFTTGTYLQYHFLNQPYSPYYEKNGAMRDENFIYNQEVVGAEWLKNYGIKGIGIQTDAIAYSRLLLGYLDKKPNRRSTNATYLYLGYANINKKLLYKDIESPIKITDFNLFVKGKEKIYENGGSEIYYSNNN